MERWQEYEFRYEFSSQQVGLRAISQEAHLPSPEFSSEISVLIRFYFKLNFFWI